MGLGVRADSLLRQVRQPTAVLIALSINILVVPLAALALSALLSPLMAGGLLVTAAVPCTLASASVWTRRGNGEDATSLFVTVLTNLFCFLITPLTLLLLMPQHSTSSPWSSSFFEQATQLAKLVLIPLVLAQFAQRFHHVQRVIKHRKALLSNLAQCGILIMVCFGASATAVRLPSGWNPWLELAPMIAVATALHLFALFSGWFGSSLLGLPRGERVAVAISGSQKTLMVGLQIALDYGVSMLPMVVYHIGQLLLDTLFVAHPRVNGTYDNATAGNTSHSGTDITIEEGTPKRAP
jgi:sodium/bile acid cotransporter 7